MERLSHIFQQSLRKHSCQPSLDLEEFSLRREKAVHEEMPLLMLTVSVCGAN